MCARTHTHTHTHTRHLPAVTTQETLAYQSLAEHGEVTIHDLVGILLKMCQVRVLMVCLRRSERRGLGSSVQGQARTGLVSSVQGQVRRGLVSSIEG
jgi:hypothetical protein